MALSPPIAIDSLLTPRNLPNAIDNNPSMVSSTQQVQWQTAFWSLISLAVLTMSQPCGKVCGARSRYRTYVRSSPFICAADTLSIIIRLVATSIYFRVSPIRALRILQHERFKDADEAEGLQNLGSSTIGRWVFAVLGPLPVMIKLASFTGTPWTQVLGTSFMVSFVVTELVILSAGDDHDARNIDGVMLPTATQDWWHGRQQHRRSNDRAIFQDRFTDFELLAALYIRYFQYFGSIQTMILSRMRLHTVSAFINTSFGKNTDDFWYVSFVVAWFVWLLICFFIIGVTKSITEMLVIAMRNFCTKHIAVGKWLAVVFPESEGSTRLVVDEISIGALLFFLVNVITGGLAYWMWFDSTGTINPHWTTIFGKLVRPSSTTPPSS